MILTKTTSHKWFSIRYYIAVIVVVLTMIGLVVNVRYNHIQEVNAYEQLVKDSLSKTINYREASALPSTTSNQSISLETIKSNKEMDTTLALMLLSTIGILASIIFNPKLSILNRKLDDYEKNNDARYSELKETVKKLAYDKDLERTLSDTRDDVLEVTNGELTQFVIDESTAFIAFAKDLSTCSLTTSSTQAILIKANKLIKESNKRADRLGKEFAEAHLASQNTLLEPLKTGIKDILNDELFNAKQKRLRILCESFLHRHLIDCVRAYKNVNNK